MSSRHGRSRSPHGGDDSMQGAAPSKRGYSDIDAYDAPGGGGSGGGNHFGGYSQSAYQSPGPPPFNNNFGPSGPNYGSNYGPNYGPSGFGPPPGNYTSPIMGPDNGGWERAAHAYKELADARQQQAKLAVELGNAKAKIHDLRARMHNRDRVIDEADSKIKSLTLERDELLEEIVPLRDAVKNLRDAQQQQSHPQQYRRAPPSRGFVPAGHDNGWHGTGRGRGGPTAHAQASAPPYAPAPAATTHAPVITPASAPVLAPAPTHAPLQASMHAPAGAPPVQDVTMTDAAGPTAPPAGTTPAGGNVGTAAAAVLTPANPAVDEELEAEIMALPPAKREVRRLLSLKGKPDEALETLGQPISAWYKCWISPAPSMAGAYTEMEFDDGDSDDDDDRTPGVDMVLADPIERFAPHMTGAASLKEENRARSKGQQLL
ncbi:hypothetical protein VTO73DRAFT_7304 [Trametes versicolor]